ncbi:uncharacterized protein LAESUDRAFT_725187 [Laetiporus sulphureus 93-53]|uniref:Uncharacterized protein n=1 Tax=Laetiporus sulphureus 93-53 TaxID=1314785 RepID=A0A165EL19_9APHY|nr:uncharacterized protein LAESUDRAFT_725187 [Laetiporus sulphureus 93-53]KZT07279.1 hypothetical protein LAESUDRAFT_725187 [Laetiporus sulphureus 93-53]
MADHDDVFGSTTSRFLSSASASLPRRTASRQSQSSGSRHSSTPLRVPSMAQSMSEEGPNARYSLAHELAVALMPEPSAGSRLLAEEFGIEYDEGAEGIDEDPEGENAAVMEPPAMQDEYNPDAELNGGHTLTSFQERVPPDVDPAFHSPTPSPRKRMQPDKDPMNVLAQDLEYTEKFLTQLRHLDADHGQSPTQPNLEKLASDMIRRINDTAHEREGQVRELLQCEREFRKIAGEVGGTEALSRLDALDDLLDEPPRSADADSDLEAIPEESFSGSTLANDWETDLDGERLNDEDDEYDPSTPVKSSFPPPPPLKGSPTPASILPQLAYLRTFTSSAVTSLAVISEHAQVNAAATTEAGRKIRALKNKLGGWRAEWENAERSRAKIQQWEAGIEGGSTGTPRLHSTRRIDGRKLVQEHLQAFEKALNEANLKTQAIMASAS